MKFLHFGDCHFDAPLLDLGQEYKKADTRRHEIKDTFSKAIEFAKEKNVDVIFLTGDLFEHKYVDKSTVIFVQEKISEIPHIKVFISPGNHDPLIHNSYYNTLSWPLNVHIFGEYSNVFLEEHNANIWGFGFEDFYVDGCKIKYFDNNDALNILVTHGTIDINISNNRYHPINSKDLLDIGFDYCALGHIHKPYIDQKNYICYSGSLEPLGFDETGEHGFIYGEITKDYKNIQFINFAKRQYYVHNVDISNAGYIEDVINKIDQEIAKECDNGFNKVILRGYAPDLNINTKLIEEKLDRLYFVKVINDTDDKNIYEEFINDNTLKGIFVRKMNHLIDKSDQKDKEMLEKALKYGIEAMSKKEIKL